MKTRNILAGVVAASSLGLAPATAEAAHVTQQPWISVSVAYGGPSEGIPYYVYADVDIDVYAVPRNTDSKVLITCPGWLSGYLDIPMNQPFPGDDYWIYGIRLADHIDAPVAGCVAAVGWLKNNGTYVVDNTMAFDVRAGSPG